MIEHVEQAVLKKVVIFQLKEEKLNRPFEQNAVI